MSEKAPSAGHEGEEIGEVIGFFAIPSAAVVKIKKGTLRVGDKIWIRGHTTDLIETVSSLQVDRQPVAEAREGQEAGLKVSSRVRPNDRVYQVSEPT